MQHTHKVALCVAALSLSVASCQPNGTQPTTERPAQMYEYEQPPSEQETVVEEEIEVEQPPEVVEEPMARAEQMGPPTEADQTFIDRTVSANMAVIEMSHMALGKSTKKPVQELAQKMIDEHTAMNDALIDLARAKGAAVVEGLSEEARENMDELDQAMGNKFEKKLLEMLEDDHENLVEALRDESEEGDDPDLRSWAAATVPTIEEHLAHIDAVQDGRPYRPLPPQASAAEQY